jgi:thioredoxin-like negative regulator of GroEL
VAKPVVDGLARKIEGKAVVARLNVNDESGSEIAARYGVRGVPAFLLLDASGKLVYRQVGGRPDTARIEQLVDGAPATPPDGASP